MAETAYISHITLPSGTTYEIKDEVARQAVAKGLEIRVVDTLPTASKDTMGALYLVPAPGSEEKNIKDEYITYQPTDSTYAWEKIGTTEIDLSDYAKKGDGVTVTLNNNVSGTDVSAHSVIDPKHTHTVSGTTTAAGTNEASSVSFATSTISASKLKTAGNVNAGTATTPAVIDTTKFNGGSPTAVTLPTFSQGEDSFTANVPTKIDTSAFNGGTPTAVTLPTWVEGTDEFTANTPTVINTAKFSGGSLSAGSFDGGSGSFTQGNFNQGTLPNLTTSVANETLTIGWSAGTLPTHGKDVHTHNVATHTQGTLTPAAFQDGFYIAGSPAEFTQGKGIWSAGSVTPGSAASLGTGFYTAGSAAKFTQGTDNWTEGDVTEGSAASLGTGFYTAGTKGTPTSVTLPTFDAVNNLVDTNNAATAAAQKFTGKASEVTGTAAANATGISIADHTVTQGKVTGNASGTINE